MKRKIIDKLASWKKSADKKPLILKGARQVGKTWALHEFGKLLYEKNRQKYHYIDFKSIKQIHSIFEETSEPEEILKLLQYQLKTKINIQKDLLILDEIQECPKAISSLKYFQQDMKELDIIAAGSHLGLLKNDESFPVGKVDFLYMFPMTYPEFLNAVDPLSFDVFNQWDLSSPIPSIIHNRLLDYFTEYLFTGGLPEVVDQWIKNSNDSMQAIKNVRKIQNNLIEGYRSDFAKYSGLVNANHINYLFDAIPAQLGRSHDESVKKLIFKSIIPNRKGFDSIRGPLTWLRESRLIIKTGIAIKAVHPLKSYTDENKFKVFLFDTGLLNSLLNIPGEVILENGIGSYKGFIMENFIAQELFAHYNRDLMSWQEGTAEIEFLINHKKEIIPLEVKSSNRHRKAKSLDTYISRYSPKQALKLTGQNYGYTDSRKITTAPLYSCSKFLESMD